MLNPSTLEDLWAAEALIKRDIAPKGAMVEACDGDVRVTIPAKGGGEYAVHMVLQGGGRWRIVVTSPSGYCTNQFVRACLPDFRESLPEEFRHGHLDWIAGPSPAWRERAVAYALAWARRSNRP